MGWFAEVLRSGSRDGFAAAAESALRRAGWQGETRYDPEAFALLFDDGDSRFDLHTVFEEFASVGRFARPGWLRRFGTMQAAILATREVATFEDARPLLLPRLRERFYHEALALQRRAGVEVPEIPLRDVSAHHVAELVCDYPMHIASVSGDMLARWDVDFDTAWSVALANLRHRAVGAVAEIGDRAYCTMTGDAHDASRLLAPEVLGRFPVRGDLVAIAPHRDALLFAGADDRDALQVIADLAAPHLEKPRAMNGMALRRVGGAWTEFLPPEDHPAYASFRKLVDASLARDCQEQEELLYAAFEHEGEGPYVASLSWLRPPDDAPPDAPTASYSVWSRDLDTLLPRSDSVALFVPGATPEAKGDLLGFVEWDELMDLLGELGLVEAQGLYPERYRVRAFPGPDALARLTLSPG